MLYLDSSRQASFSRSLFLRIGRSRLFDEIDFRATIVRSFRTSALFRNRGENVPGKDTLAPSLPSRYNVLPLSSFSPASSKVFHLTPRVPEDQILPRVPQCRNSTRVAIPKNSLRRTSPVNKEYFYLILISRENRANIESVLRGGIDTD